jgi:predicted transcriptional regulator of viral defense system/very-short-patch-repair endonuclease
MAPRTAPRITDRRIVEFAQRRHDIVTVEQLRSLGVTPSGVRTRHEARLLHLQYRGVYCVGRARPTREGRWLAAVLACGDGAVLSHRSAGALWGVVRTDRPRVDVTMPTRNGPPAGRRIARHRPRRPLEPHEVTTLRGIRVTTVARTLLDLADELDERGLARAVERAEELRVFDLVAIEAIVAAHAGRRKTGRLVRALERYDPAPTRSELERMFLALCAAEGIVRPRVNEVVAGLEVDFFWPGSGFAVEADGFATHGTRAAFERDRRRDGILALAGVTCRRFSHRQVRHELAFVAAVVRAGLSSRATGHRRSVP